MYVRGCLFQFAPAYRLLEFPHVARDQIRVEPQVAAAAEKDVVRPQVLTQGVECLVETPPSSLLLGISPEVCQHLLAGKTLLAGTGQESQDGEAPGLRRRTADDSAVSANVEPSKRMYPQHVESGESEVIPL